MPAVGINRIDPVVGTGMVFVARWFSDAEATVPADPTAVTFRVQLPSDDPEDLAFVYGTDDEVTKVSTGVYEFRYASPEAGWVDYQAVATGAIEDTIEWRVKYRTTAFDAVAGGAT